MRSNLGSAVSERPADLYMEAEQNRRAKHKEDHMKHPKGNDFEDLIRKSAFPNPDHKKLLLERLREQRTPLSPDDLETVTGGADLSAAEPEEWILWPVPQEDQEKNKR